jgi:hypothetical protein
MRPFRGALIVVVSLGLMIPGVGDAIAGKEAVDYESQASYTFVNEEGVPAHGLHVVLSKAGQVVTHPETGYAGPFRDIQGNGTEHLKLSNPRQPVPSNGEESEFEIRFRSSSSKLQVKKWWWVDEQGKLIGEKKNA